MDFDFRNETVEQFLARGGKITRCKAGSNTTVTNREFIKRDSQIKEMRKLRNQLKDDKAIALIDLEIARRIEVLK